MKEKQTIVYYFGEEQRELSVPLFFVKCRGHNLERFYLKIMLELGFSIANDTILHLINKKYSHSSMPLSKGLVELFRNDIPSFYQIARRQCKAETEAHNIEQDERSINNYITSILLKWGKCISFGKQQKRFLNADFYITDIGDIQTDCDIITFSGNVEKKSKKKIIFITPPEDSVIYGRLAFFCILAENKINLLATIEKIHNIKVRIEIFKHHLEFFFNLDAREVFENNARLSKVGKMAK